MLDCLPHISHVCDWWLQYKFSKNYPVIILQMMITYDMCQWIMQYSAGVYRVSALLFSPLSRPFPTKPPAGVTLHPIHTCTHHVPYKPGTRDHSISLSKHSTICTNWMCNPIWMSTQHAKICFFPTESTRFYPKLAICKSLVTLHAVTARYGFVCGLNRRLFKSCDRSIRSSVKIGKLWCHKKLHALFENRNEKNVINKSWKWSI